MKTALLFATAALGILALVPAAQAGPRVGVYVNFGGGGYCAPRYAPPVCYVPRRSYYCPPPVAYYQPAPVYYAPRISSYRAPVVSSRVVGGGPAFGWRR